VTALATRPGAVGASRTRRSDRAARPAQSGIAWLLLTPFLVIFVVFTAVPVVASLAMSVTDMRSTDLRNPFGVDVVGFENYLELLTDPTFLQAALNTLYVVVVGVPLTMAIGFALALVLDQGIRRFRGIFRALFYAPVVANIVSVALIWQYAFNQNGTVNSVLAAVGLAGPNWLGPNWLGDERLAMPVVILLGVWRNFGTAMLLFLAGLQTLPKEVYEAAALDGAGRWRQLWSITVPLMTRTTLLVSVLLTVFFLQVFDEPYLLTDGGPLGSTESMALFTYHQFGFGNIGTASAASFVLLVIVAVVSALQFRILRARA
jgi:multiple sugar transport system permease protein